MYSKIVGKFIDDSFKLIGCLLWIIMVLAIVLIVLVTSLFLSSRPAGASHGPTGYVIHDCCRGINPASGTSYRTVALAFRAPVRPVFEGGTQPIEYILQWPHLESTTSQLIHAARQRLGVVLAVDAVPSVVRENARLSIEWGHTVKALGMACFFGGLMLLITLWPYRKDSSN